MPTRSLLKSRAYGSALKDLGAMLERCDAAALYALLEQARGSAHRGCEDGSYLTGS